MVLDYLSMTFKCMLHVQTRIDIDDVVYHAVNRRFEPLVGIQ